MCVCVCVCVCVGGGGGERENTRVLLTFFASVSSVHYPTISILLIFSHIIQCVLLPFVCMYNTD